MIAVANAPDKATEEQQFEGRGQSRTGGTHDVDGAARVEDRLAAETVSNWSPGELSDGESHEEDRDDLAGAR
jgi:hypothetical protein